MKAPFKYIVFIAFSMTFLFSTAQLNELDFRMAMNYYNNGDFEKAAMYFDKLYSKSNLNEIYEPYRRTLIELDRFKEAEKICKLQVKNYPEKYNYLVDYGKLMESWDKEEKANTIYNEAIGKIDANSEHVQISNLANAFEKGGMFDHALKVYQLGNKYSSTQKRIYNQKIAYIYGRQGKTELVISTLLELLETSDAYYSVVQRGLNNSIDLAGDIKGREVLKKTLIKKSQQNPGKIIYNEMLAWYFSTIDDFEGSFIQVKAIDKKQRAGGKRLLELGESCYINEAYDVAIKCYNEIIKNYPSTNMAGKAKAKTLKVLKSKLLAGGNVTNDQLLVLKDNYLKTIDDIKSYFPDFERDSRYISVIRDLSELEAYYLHEYAIAEERLRKLLSSGFISKRIKGEIKLELAEILVLKGIVYDASLLYLQLEKEFKHDPIGHEAKYKNAKIYYYVGEFEWCQAQLDVLKASTSKLIANDAMDLSLLITDNYNLDTTEVTMKLFAKADLYIIQHKYKEAEAIFDSINHQNGYHTLNDDILFRRANIFIKQHLYEKAVEELKKILADYSDDILADNALFILGELYEKKFNDPEKAKECYKKILFEHSGSLYVVEARKRYRRLTGKNNEDIKSDSL